MSWWPPEDHSVQRDHNRISSNNEVSILVFRVDKDKANYLDFYLNYLNLFQIKLIWGSVIPLSTATIKSLRTSNHQIMEPPQL